MKIEKVKQAIKKWSEVRTSPEDVIAYFKQGCCFKIEKSQYEMWKRKSPKTVIAYVGVFENKLNFFLVDNVSEKDMKANLNSVFVESYLKRLPLEEEGFILNALDGNIPVIDALKRVALWNLFMPSWVYNVVDTINGIFQAFIIPFDDFEEIFEGTNHAETVAIIGLRPDNTADLTLWPLVPCNENFISIKAVKGSAGVEDLVTPVPPMGAGLYSLL